MTALLVFACVLLAAVLISEYASRSVLSVAVVFLAAGFFAGEGMLGWVAISAGDPVVETFAELALFSVLFTDGMRVGARDLLRAWRLPGRALLFGMPLTFGLIAVLAHYLVGLGWTEALLVGAVLAPTDPVFAAAVVGRKEVPGRLRHLLNVESGVNDGLALPLVLVMLAQLGGTHVDAGHLLLDIGLGVALGVVVPWAALWLEGRRFFSARAVYEALLGLSIALLLYALTHMLPANPFLAAFAAGVTIATVSERAKHAFHEHGEFLAELLKLGALLVFGALIAPGLFAEFGAGVWVFAVAVLVVARPVALSIAFFGRRFSWPEWVTVAWFGPKGFASVVFALLVLHGTGDRGPFLFNLLALVVVLSMVAHSSTDVLVARWFRRHDPEAGAASEALAAEAREAALAARIGAEVEAREAIQGEAEEGAGTGAGTGAPPV